MENGLKECPFCGKETAKILDKFDLLNGAVKKYNVKCSECGVATRECNTKFEAIDCWNTRKGEL